ncbi:nucleoside 2-deoxyribosyltransferase [Shouchella hunanensis]|uniref:Nucleoside 2-deoxyribosyltransferase n=3 Tax=Shouchella TaxID=2893057 RepID=A0ABY7W0D1_9BACI|nr:nucleoside 2-deoxyribosyltransferase [Shouchella hunanensis]WDF02001.1 nucleoside 2-deoxyribosyltransferase [Shouchella hunanensis]
MSQGKKMFLAGPFKSLVNSNTGIMGKHEKQKLINLISFFETRGFSVHNAHKREGWGKDFMTPEECTEIDFKEISACDLFVAFPGAPASPGTHIEIGWASALNKPIVLLLEEEKDYAFLINGLGTIANVTFIRFRTEEDYFSQLDKVYLQIV